MAEAVHPTRPASRRPLAGLLLVLALGSGLLISCSDDPPSSDLDEISTTTRPGRLGGPHSTSVSEKPEVQITLCVEDTSVRSDIVDGATAGLTDLLNALADPEDDNALGPQSSFPAVGITVRPMTADSFPEYPVMDFTIPSQEPLSVDVGKVDLDDPVDPTQDRAKADRIINAQLGKLEDGLDYPTATENFELTGCGARASEDFAKAAPDAHHILVIVSSGISKEEVVGDQNQLRLNGSKVFAMLQCTKDDPRRSSTISNDLCNDAHCNQSKWIGWSGVVPDRTECTVSQPRGQKVPEAKAESEVFEEGESGDWTNLVTEIMAEPALQPVHQSGPGG